MRNYGILVKVSLEEKKSIKSNAKRFGYSASGYLRQLGTSKIYSTEEVLNNLPKIILQERKRRGLRPLNFQNEGGEKDG